MVSIIWNLVHLGKKLLKLLRETSFGELFIWETEFEK